MAFKPANIERTHDVDTAPLAYYVRTFKRKSRKTNEVIVGADYITFRIVANMGARCGFKKGDGVRIDLDIDNGWGCLLRVDNSSRHFCQGGTKHWSFTCVFPHTGDLQKHFPKQLLTNLKVVEYSVSKGLIFELPKP